MASFTLTVIDTAGIQEYIFGSNSLMHNIGASALVDWATHQCVYETLLELGPTNVDIDGKIDTTRAIEDNKTPPLKSELVYTGGGNTVILFQNHDLEHKLAKEFTRRLSRQVLHQAPGLELVIAHNPVDLDSTDLQEQLSHKVAQTLEQVQKKKGHRVHSAPLLGLGVTADCQYTGLPATDQRLESQKPGAKLARVSSETAAKLDFFVRADKRLQKLFPQVKKPELEFVYDFDDLGDKGRFSYLAVIHADGNGMGARVQQIVADPKNQSNRNYIAAMRGFSGAVEQASAEALQVCVQKLLASRDEEGKVIGGVVNINDGKLPFRPIVFGGDDVTLVCDGRLGLTVAAAYLEAFESAMNEEPITAGMKACAGVAVVKSHYPFARAYAHAEALCGSAKEVWQRQHTALDWHFAVSGAVLDIEQIRRRQYTVRLEEGNGFLTMRPLYLDQGTDWRSWATFQSIVREFQGVEWAKRRNKVKALRDALRAGPEATQQFVIAYEPHHLPQVGKNNTTAQTGWIGDHCTCFDAIEALEFYVPLTGGEK